MKKYSDLTTKTARVAFLRLKMESNLFWATEGLKKIYEAQTFDEKACGDTRNLNGVGFTGTDGEILSSFARQVTEGRRLTDKQQAILFHKMPKYAKQLSAVADAKGVIA